MIKFYKIYFFLFIFFSFTFSVFASNVDGTITPSPKYAFGENLGWINFGCDNCNVHITDTGITGYAWSKSHGWINLSPSGSGVTNNCSGILGGKAWSKSLGWVDFSGVTIDTLGKFTGMAGTPGTKAGRINFNCDSCGVTTEWQQCLLRESPAQVLINSITNSTIPQISANITITNEGNIDTEYQYEWCVVSDISNDCGGGDDVYYSSGAKLIAHGDTWTTTKDATVPISGTYYFKLVAHYGVHFSTSTKLFNAVSSGGGGAVSSVIDIFKFNVADFSRDYKVNSIDFSILLYFWKAPSPFKNLYVDINKDNKVDSVDFSILLYEWDK
ncbi:MAG: dockerin type I domain-containing protein [Candidatus Paceibacterota bacterium]